ncbi:kinase-like domain-containing protein [Mycena crocata]|nr:kinase-like domain-containing protein [Mycena crocata]
MPNAPAYLVLFSDWRSTNLCRACFSPDAWDGNLILSVGTATQNLEVDVAVDEDDAWVTPAAEQRYEGWVASVVAPLSGFIDKSVNPRDHYLDLGEIGEGRGGTTVSVARLAERHRDHLDLPEHVKEKDQHDLLTRNTTFVAIKSVPIMPSDSTKLWDVLRELRIMHGIRCDNILGLDALYIDPVEDTLWIRMELMERTLSSVIELNGSGVVLSDQIIAGCTKDILAALENLRVNDIAPRNIRSDNILINKHGVLKLSMFSPPFLRDLAPNSL